MNTVFLDKPNPHFRGLNQSILLGLFLFLVSSYVFAGALNLAWDPSTSTGVAGYKLYYGQASKNYTSSVDVGNTTSYQMTGLTAGSTYFFALKAYNAAKSIESSFSNEASATISATTTLTADFTASQSSTSSTIESFTSTVTGIPSGTVPSYAWNFGDNTTSTASNPTKTYAAAGTYTVNLNVTAGTTSAAKSKAITVTLAAAPPVANFSASPTSTTVGVSVSFADTSTGSITSRSWNFGDGTTSSLQNPTHAYSAVGTYTVSLTATGSGGSNTKTSAITVSATPSVTNTNTGLVAAYGFEEASGTTVVDASGNGNNGVMTNAVRVAPGKFGNALQFNGTNALVKINDSASLKLTTGMTLEAWVMPSAINNLWKDVIEKGDDNYFLMATSNRSSVPVGGGTFGEINGTSALPVNTWTHLAVTYDGVTQRLFVNGAQVSSIARTGNIATSTGPLQIGGDSIYGQYFNGYIDEVRVYNRALAQTEIAADKDRAIGAVTSKVLMGDTKVESFANYKTQGVALAHQVVPTISGSPTQVSVYLDSSLTTATSIKVGVYTDRVDSSNIHHAGTLLAQGTLGTLKAGWNSVPISPLSTPFTVTAGKPYWLAILTTAGQFGYRYNSVSGTGLLEKSSSNRLTNLPTTWTGSTSGYITNATMSIYGMGN
ncbi:PDK repeat-containing protein [Methyloglobulus morosus KoM1]|uniref:PDK repeat-containing protein n=1 Tax=Methyloglobulus morosus KoM1 TaxID=1116472 RepID=V5BX49_9GAMM|nr:LamG-like jellyroll fold domain-containing protein [Methyloglobulus morosus]ESS72439.1 PDK repeat-containing protein [Methyloglobulus morosus KoM1]